MNTVQIGSITTSFIEIPGQICTSIYLSGCDINCFGCQNPELQDPAYGEEYVIDDIVCQMNSNTLAKWVCFLGGEPFYQSEQLYKLCCSIKKPIGIYSGHTFEYLQQNHANILDLPNVQFLKTGSFDIELLVPNKFPATTNQEIHFRDFGVWNVCSQNTAFISNKLYLITLKN